MLIAERPDGTALGFISLNVVEDVTGAERGHVADLAVTDTARDRGLLVPSLDVWSTNQRAQAFSTRLGYRAESLHEIKTLR